MRIMFKRPAQFPLPDGKVTAVYAPDVEHDIDDVLFDKIQGSLLFRHMKGAGDLVFIKSTAPSPAETKKAKAEEKPEEKQDNAPAQSGESQGAAPSPAETKKAGKKPKA